jgi:hypothetical protein
MRAERKKFILVGGGALALIVVAVIVAVSFLDINPYRHRIEAAASEAIGMDVSIKGKLGIGFFPFGVSANDIHVGSKQGEILSIKTLKLRVELIPLLKKQLKITGCELVQPTISIVEYAEGKHNIEISEMKPAEDALLRAASSLREIRLSQAALVHLDKKTGEKTELKEINLAIEDLSIGGAAEDIMKNVSFTGSLDCREVRSGNLQIDNVKSPMKAEKGVIRLAPLTMDVFGAKGEGDATADMSSVDAVYGINLKVSKLDFATLEESFGVGKMIGGNGDLHASLTIEERGSRNLMSTMGGTLSLRGDNLPTYTMDLDKVLSSYETSQEFNLVDLGALFIGGPLIPLSAAATVVLTGYRYGELYSQTQGGQGVITQFISHWKIKDGVAEATDCALATQHNRVALIGKLNLVSGRYDDVTVALLDDNGCAKFKQGISGPFGSPQVGAVSAVEALGGPISKLYRKAKRMIQGSRCAVVYHGSVRQPEVAAEVHHQPREDAPQSHRGGEQRGP